MVDVKKMRADIELLRTSEPMSESFHDAQVRLLRSLADLLELLDAWGYGTLGGPEKTQVETPLERAKREGRERDVLKAALDWYAAVVTAGSDRRVPVEEAALLAAARSLGPVDGMCPRCRNEAGPR